MKNPYEVLGLKENASADEIKKAYRELVKKYHPDKYRDNPLSDLAENKMQEINEAYDYLMKNAKTNSSYSYSQSSSSQSRSNHGSYYQNNSNQNYQRTQGNYSGYSGTSGRTTTSDAKSEEIKRLIFQGNFSLAQQMLDSFKVRDAAWYYLQGLLYLRRGWYDRAYTLLKKAVDLDPQNYEYQDAMNQLNNQFYGFRRQSYNRGYRNDPDMCNLCASLWCADSCCECMGGDLIGCC